MDKKPRFRWTTFLSEDDAPTMVEYGLLVLVIALVALVGVTTFGQAVKNLFDTSVGPFP